MNDDFKFVERNKFLQLWLIIGIVAGFAGVIFFSITYLNEKVLCDIGCRQQNEVSLILILLSLFGMFVGSLTYYFISDKYKRKIIKIHKDSNLTLRFLDKEDRMILDCILKNNGRTTQSEISRITGFNRVRIFRALRRLEDKDIILRKPYGMTNFVELKEDLKKVFLE